MTAVLITAAVLLGGLFVLTRFTNSSDRIPRLSQIAYITIVLLAALWGWNEVVQSIIWPVLGLFVISGGIATVFAELDGSTKSDIVRELSQNQKQNGV